MFGPRPRDFHLELSKKMKRVALASALTSKLRDRAVIVIEGLASMKPKTSIMARTLSSYNLYTQEHIRRSNYSISAIYVQRHRFFL